MNDREKLVELLGAAEDDYLEKISEVMTQEQRYEIVKNAYAYYADHLLANGVTVQKHGRWEDHLVRDWHCSECGKKAPKQVRFDGYCYADKLNYCPNCGARMDLEG